MSRLRLFFYDEADCRLREDYVHRPLPALRELNPEYYERVSDPGTADFIVFPVLLTDIGVSHPEDPDYIYRYLPTLPLWREYEAKHVFFLIGPDTWVPLFTRAVVFRTSVHRRFPDLNVVAHPFMVRDPGHNADYSEVIYNTCFTGFLGSWPGRLQLALALRQASGLNCFIKVTDKFFHHLPPEQQAESARLFQESMRQSLTVCCPRGAGLNSIRFFETLAMGRIPILISDDCVLPREEDIQYDQFILRLPEGNLPKIGELLSDWFTKAPADEVARRCLAARTTWDDYLSPAREEDFVKHALERIKASGYQLYASRQSAVAELGRQMKAEGQLP